MPFSEDVESISDILKDNLAAGFPMSDVHRKLTLWPGPVPIVDGPLSRTFCGGTKKEDAKNFNERSQFNYNTKYP